MLLSFWVYCSCWACQHAHRASSPATRPLSCEATVSPQSETAGSVWSCCCLTAAACDQWCRGSICCVSFHLTPAAVLVRFLTRRFIGEYASNTSKCFQSQWCLCESLVWSWLLSHFVHWNSSLVEICGKKRRRKYPTFPVSRDEWR